jgi:hypothetical protein
MATSRHSTPCRLIVYGYGVPLVKEKCVKWTSKILGMRFRYEVKTGHHRTSLLWKGRGEFEGNHDNNTSTIFQSGRCEQCP